jgi:hypothetical protein
MAKEEHSAMTMLMVLNVLSLWKQVVVDESTTRK